MAKFERLQVALKESQFASVDHWVLDKSSKILNLMLGSLLVASGVAVILLTALGFDNGSEFAAMSPVGRAVLATVLVGSGLVLLLKLISQPQSASDYAGRHKGAGVAASQLNLRIVALWVGTAAAVFLAVFYGRVLLGDERVQISDAGMEPLYSMGDAEWASTDVERIDKFDVVVIDTAGLGRPSLPNVIVRRVAAVEGQRVDSQGIRIFVDRVWYSVGAEGESEGEWSVPVPAGEVFLLADNRNTGVDSRELGTVPVDAILGVISTGAP